MYGFYQDTYGGTALEAGEFPAFLARAQDQLDLYERCYRVSGDEKARKMALCAMAELIGYYDAAQNGQGALRYASVGTVSASGKGIYSQLDISPKARDAELYRTACRYLTIYRGTAGA